MVVTGDLFETSSPESLTQEDIMAGGQAELDKAKARAAHLMR